MKEKKGYLELGEQGDVIPDERDLVVRKPQCAQGMHPASHLGFSI